VVDAEPAGCVRARTTLNGQSGTVSDPSSTWLTAASDLGIAVTAPTTVNGEEVVAVVHDFGSERGTAVVSLGSERQGQAVSAARAGGYFVSVVRAAAYDRADFIATLDDWGWYGSGDPPPWYSGRPWSP
jgi:hypothetical protein